MPVYQQSRTWRYINACAASGPYNMAVDEALLRCFVPGESLPVLRLYGWAPPALSLGRFQNARESLDLQRCRDLSLPVVRRVTGGGAIYHADELTYSIVCSPAQIPPASSIKDSFRIITGFLLKFYRELGLDAAYAVESACAGRQLGERTAYCFAGRETFDIMVTGRKIGGNAQRRLRELIFQHGSIPVVNRSVDGLLFMGNTSPEQATDTSSLQECGIKETDEVLRRRLAIAFSEYFGVTLEPCGLSPYELETVERLFRMKYGSEDWNLEGMEQ